MKRKKFVGQQQCWLVICNFLPSQQEIDQQQANTSTASSSIRDDDHIGLLPLWMGDLVHVSAQRGNWAFGHRLEEPEKQGLFPCSNILELATGKGRPASSQSEAEQLAAEIGEAVKAWWECITFGYGSAEPSSSSSNNGQFEQEMVLVRQLMMARRRLRSGTVPAEELRELRLTVVKAIDAGNHAMRLCMCIRDLHGRAIQAKDLSVVNAYKKHEEAFQRIASQSQLSLDSASVENPLAGQPAENAASPSEWALLISLDHSELAATASSIGQQTVELVLGLGKVARPKTGHKATNPLSEPLTIRLPAKNGKVAGRQQSRALFVGLTDADINDGNSSSSSLSLWVNALRMAALAGEKPGGSANKGGEEVRQFYAHGQVHLGELVREMVDKEQREMVLQLARKSDSPPCPSNQNLAGEHASPAAHPNSNSASSERLGKVSIALTVQLFAGALEHLLALNPELRLIPQLRKLKGNSSAAEGRELDAFYIAEERRNEVFVWLRDGDLHGIGKSEKNIEAVVSVVDDDGIFQPEAIELITPEGPVRESSFRCRVWPAEDRPRFNELIKVLLPDQEVRNLHLQILFYNKLATSDNKKSSSAVTSSSSKGPFALAFLRLLHNFVLCSDEEDELHIYRVDKGGRNNREEPMTSTNSLTPLNVAYLASLARKKENRQLLGLGVPVGRAPSMAKLGDLAMGGQQQVGGGGMYTLCERNGLHFQSFVNSHLHSSSQTLVQILRWRDTNRNLLLQRLLDLTILDLGELDEELSKFLPDLLDAIFQMAETLAGPLQRPLFDALVHICRLSEESRHSTVLKQRLEQYVQHMHFPTAHSFLLEHIIWYVSNYTTLTTTNNSRADGGGGEVLVLNFSTQHQTAQLHRGGSSIVSSSSRDQLLLVLKSLGILIRLALASKCCSNLIRESTNASSASEAEVAEEEQRQFVHQLNCLRSSLVLLLGSAVRRMTGQNAAMKHLPSLILPLLSHRIYEPLELANYVKEVLDSLSEGILLRQRLLFLDEIVGSELFASLECRQVLLERFLTELLAQMPPHVRQEEHIRNSLNRRDSVPDSASASGQLESVQLSARILADLLDRLFPYSRQCPVDQMGTGSELTLILTKCLRPLNQTMVTLLGDPRHQRSLHALLLAILDKFSARHFLDYFASLAQPLNKIDALSEMLHMFRDLMLRCPVPQEWAQIRRLQSRLFLKHIRFASAFCQREFGPGGQFEAQLWHECMLSCVSFAKWMALEEKRWQVNCTEVNCGDEEGEWDNNEEMREFTVKMLRSMWHSLNPEAKMEMMPAMIGPVLEVTLSEDGGVRELAMPIFFDMLSTEHWLSQQQTGSAGVVLRKGHHQQRLESSRFGDEFLARLDATLDTSAVDERAFADFGQHFNRAFQQQTAPRSAAALGREADAMRAFVQKVNKLLELFAAYVSVLERDDQLEMGMFCTVQLVDFYHSIGQNALYLVYLYKLYSLHISTGNSVEAALTLQRHANLLKWTNERPSEWLYGARKQNSAFGTQLELKEHIYQEMAELFTKGGHWELAIETNKELANVYEGILFDYAKLATLLRRNAELHERVIKEIRLESNYFLVAFYGRECPAYLANRKFVFRGEQLELWAAFKQRLLLNSFASFKFIDSMDDCDQQMADAQDKHMQVIAVQPIASTTYTALLQSPSRLASWYYRHHRIQRFELVRREFRPATKWTQLEDTESMRLWLHKKIITVQRPLPDLLSFAPMVTEQDQEPMNPVEVAIERVREANDKLADLSGKVGEGFGQQFLMNLGGMIRGIVQADVGGGIKNYQAFFSAQCRAQCSEEENRTVEQLRLLILEQVTLLELALFVHASADQAKANAGFHNSLVASFHQHRSRVEGQLGPAKSILPPGATVYVLEQQQQQQKSPATVHGPGESRLSAQSSSALTSPISTRSVRSQSISESQHRLNSVVQPQQPPTTIARPPSAASGSNSTGSTASNSTAAAIFRNSPLGTASSLIRNTIQGKSKKMRKASTKSTGEPHSHLQVQQGASSSLAPGRPSSSSHLLSAAAFLSQARASDDSIENCCFPLDSLGPPLPARESKLHSAGLLSGRNGRITN